MRRERERNKELNLADYCKMSMENKEGMRIITITVKTIRL